MPDPTEQVDPEKLTTEELVRQLVEETRKLLDDEVRLAREHMTKAAKHSVVGVATLVVGGVLGFTGFLVLSWDIVYLLAFVMPLWVSALIVGVGWMLVGGLFAWGAKRELTKAKSSSQEWLENVKEDAQWTRKTIHGVQSRTHASA